VRVTVDRPLGSRHPRYPDLLYPLNYGFLPGTVSGDGEPIDAYVVGCDEPVAEASGVVVAAVLRADDAEDKLVVAADGRWRSAEEIGALVAFQERFFASRVVMAENGAAEAATDGEPG
jgi:inorganic pyrophosphatase